MNNQARGNKPLGERGGMESEGGGQKRGSRMSRVALPPRLNPNRTARIDGFRYQLKAVDYRNKLYTPAEAYNASFGCSRIDVSMSHRWHYTWRETEKGAPARIKIATPAQLKKWGECKAFRDAPAWEHVGLLWQRVDALPVLYCQDDCKRCKEIKAHASYLAKKAEGKL